MKKLNNTKQTQGYGEQIIGYQRGRGSRWAVEEVGQLKGDTW